MKRVLCDNHKVSNLIDKLAEQIKDEPFHVTKIVAINRGGMIPARLLATRLDIRRIYSIGVEFYNDDKKGKVPVIYQGFTEQFENNDNVLIVDDIFDSGMSMNLVENRVRLNGTHNIMGAVLHIKEHSCTTPGCLIPRFFGEWAKKNEWIEYYWENG